jgi:hypothetical protein
MRIVRGLLLASALAAPAAAQEPIRLTIATVDNPT